jgi:hypothetical protein
VTGLAVVLVDKSTGAAVTSGTTTVYLTQDGGTQGAIAGAATHEGNGQWTFNLTAGEMTADLVALVAVNTAAAPVGLAIKTVTLSDIADAFLARDLGSGSGAGTLNERTVRAALRILRNKMSIASTTLTVTKEDDSTTAWTGVVTATAGADPVTGMDPT